MKETYSYAIKYILFYVVIPFLIGFGIGHIIKAEKEKAEQKSIQLSVGKFNWEYVDLGMDLNSKTVKLDPAVDTDQQQIDHLIADYILKSHTLFEEVYKFSRDKNLLTKDFETYKKCLTLMNSIYDSQLEAYGKVHNIFSVGMASSIFIIECEQTSAMTNEMTSVACEEILKIDPTNQQAR